MALFVSQTNTSVSEQSCQHYCLYSYRSVYIFIHTTFKYKTKLRHHLKPKWWLSKSSNWDFYSERNERSLWSTPTFLSNGRMWSHAERRSKGRTSINRDRACYKLVYQEEKKTSDQLSLEQFFKKVMSLEVLLSIKISYLLWLNSCIMYHNCQNHCFIVAHKQGFLCTGVSKTPDGFNFLRQSGKILLTLSGAFHAHENFSQSLLFEYDTLWPQCCSKHSCSHDAKAVITHGSISL